MTQDHETIQKINALESDPLLEELLAQIYQETPVPPGLTDSIFQATVSELNIQPEIKTLKFPSALRYASIAAICLLAITSFLFNQSTTPTTDSDKMLAMVITDIEDSFDNYESHQKTISNATALISFNHTTNTADAQAEEPQDLAYMAEKFSEELDELLAADIPSGL